MNLYLAMNFGRFCTYTLLYRTLANLIRCLCRYVMVPSFVTGRGRQHWKKPLYMVFCDHFATFSKDSAVCNTRYGDCAVAGFTQKNLVPTTSVKSFREISVALQRGSLSAFIDMAGTLDSNTRPVLSTNAKPEPSITLKDCPRSMVGGHLTMGNYKRFHHRIDGSRPFTKENHIG